MVCPQPDAFLKIILYACIKQDSCQLLTKVSVQLILVSSYRRQEQRDYRKRVNNILDTNKISNKNIELLTIETYPMWLTVFLDQALMK